MWAGEERIPVTLLYAPHLLWAVPIPRDIPPGEQVDMPACDCCTPMPGGPFSLSHSRSYRRALLTPPASTSLHVLFWHCDSVIVAELPSPNLSITHLRTCLTLTWRCGARSRRQTCLHLPPAATNIATVLVWDPGSVATARQHALRVWRGSATVSISAAAFASGNRYHLLLTTSFTCATQHAPLLPMFYAAVTATRVGRGMVDRRSRCNPPPPDLVSSWTLCTTADAAGAPPFQPPPPSFRHRLPTTVL